MTSRVFLNKRYKSKDDTYPLVIRLILGRKQKLIPTGFKIKESQWADNAVRKHPDAAIINSKIDDLLSTVRRYISSHTIYNLDDVFKKETGNSFTGYLIHRASQYKDEGKYTMYRKTERLATEVKESLGEITFEDITQDHLRKLNIYLKENHQNTRENKFAKLRQLFEKAIQEGRARHPNPFKQFTIGKVPTKKEKLTEAEIKALESVELPDDQTRMARDLFMFAYYSKGVRFENCITAKRSDIKNGRIYFKINKGKAFLSVQIHPKLQAIIDRYSGPFLFPYLKEDLPLGEEKRRKALDIINTMVNRNLKIAAGIAKIQKHVTMHISRHSFAFHMKQKSGNISAIKDSLGHSSTLITERYLQALDDESLDKEVAKLYR